MQELMKNSTLAYQGKVVAKLKLKDTIISTSVHNYGTKHLMKCFCKFLSGNYSGSSDIPTYIDVVKSDNNFVTKISCLKEKIGLTSNSYEMDETDNWIAKFTAVIKFDSLIEPITADESIYKYRLYLVSGYDNVNAVERYHDLAYVDISADSLSNLVSSVNLIVEWTMKLINYSDYDL